jgi:transposase
MEPGAPNERFSPEIKERMVRMVTDHTSEYSSQWTAIRSIAEKFGCEAETLRR